MPPYLQRGSIPKKRHTAHEAHPGFENEGIFYEEVISSEGFSRAYSIAYHQYPPTRVVKIESMPARPVVPAPEETLRHIHLKTSGMAREGDPIFGRIPLFFNAECRIGRCRPALPQETLYRNARKDELIFIHSGSGCLLSMYGSLPFGPMDYLIIPKTTTYQLVFDAISEADMLVVEATGTIGFPARYINPDGQFRLGAPLCERDLRGPQWSEPHADEENVALWINDDDRWTKYTLANHPFDVVGWDGMVYPFAFNADDFEPITGTVHQPPPIHQTFQAAGFVVCTFAPRMLDTHPQAIKVPYAHSNIESDEVLYYVRGQFGSRRGVESGSITLHPHGIPHGPHPGTIVASRPVTHTNELAVMIDTFHPLHRTKAALELDDPNYPFTWI
ncbi:MAG: homogentisate 1,2-dioxygenase domain-containing protein [Planctomycetota bacterium]